jgi:hypothetical protein
LPMPTPQKSVSFLELGSEGQFLQSTPPRQKPAPADDKCEHNLAQVDNDAVYAVMDGSYKHVPVPKMAASKELTGLRGQRYFIAACLHQADDILPQWSMELIRLLLALRQADTEGAATNVFVSIYESGSNDTTKLLLEDLRGHLNFLGVPNSIVLGNMYRNGTNRIEFLGAVRNKALEPLHNTASYLTFDQVVWLNDIWYCADAVLQVMHHASPVALGGLGADAVCGEDFVWEETPHHMQCKFYDTWVSHDIAGSNIMTSYRTSQDEPYQAFSCWNGLVSFAGDLFQRHNLKFRRNNPDLHECAASESELIFHDMHKLGRSKVAISPLAAVAYHPADWSVCARKRQPKSFSNNTVLFEPPPREVTCCPLPEKEELVNFAFCECKEWDSAAETSLFEANHGNGSGKVVTEKRRCVQPQLEPWQAAEVNALRAKSQKSAHVSARNPYQNAVRAKHDRRSILQFVNSHRHRSPKPHGPFRSRR